MRTFIRWPGNKLVYAKRIIKLFPSEIRGTYYEPFLGSGAIFLTLQPQKWVINDLNVDIYNLWSFIYQDINKFITKIKQFRKEFQIALQSNQVDTFAKTKIEYLNKTVGSSSKESLKRTVTYVMMKYIAYLGHIFVNNKFAFVGLENNILKGKPLYYMGEKYLANIKSVNGFMKGDGVKGKIMNGDYRKVIRKAKKGDFVFLDPPYYEPEVDYKFNYNKNEKVGNSFIKDLKNEVDKLDKKGVQWLMTQADTPFIREVFGSKYTIQELRVYRRTKNMYVNELIITNY